LDKQDSFVEQQVWQRVRASREEMPQNDLRQLQREALELAAAYRTLASRLTGRQREQMQKLYRGEQANAAALAGIGFLSRQPEEQLKFWQPEKEEPGKILVRCYYRTRRCMTEYLARSAQTEFGVVFEQLARREAAHCVLLAEVLGELR